MKSINILLIGFGAHAKRIYYNVAKLDGNTYGFGIVAALDIESKKPEIESFLQRNNETTIQMYYTSGHIGKDNKLLSTDLQALHEIVEKHHIQGVIIASDPLTHVAYSCWALSQGLSILMDKPVSVHKQASTDAKVATKLILDYNHLADIYTIQKQKHPTILFSLMAQRRFHPAFRKIKKLIEEVHNETNCPITSIQSFHGDGQWRMPEELLNLKYHGFTDGYGKCSHSGYHFFDIVAWLLEAGEGANKNIDTVEIFTNAVRPNDFLSQVTIRDYERLFPNEHITDIPEKRIQQFGEIDAFSTFAFKKNNKTISLGSINLTHNSFSQRGWFSSAHRDLYKGNGRLRHEVHIIEQGPFQAIEFISLQSEEIRPYTDTKLYEPGGEYHLDIHVFRNHALFPKWNSYQKYSVADLSNRTLESTSRGHQEDARRTAVIEFISSFRKQNINPISEITDHRRSIILMSGIYQSMANRFSGKNPLITLPFSKYA